MLPPLTFIDPSISTDNTGDLFIVDSVKRIVRHDPVKSFHIDPRRPIGATDIDRINRTSAVLIAGTNLWYQQIRKPGRWTFTSEDLKKIKVPIIPMGVGTTRHNPDEDSFDEETTRQLRIIHESCAAGSARDARTLRALNGAGIKNVIMSGCPTLFRSLKPTWSLRERSASNRVAVTVRKGQASNVYRLFGRLRARGLEPYVAAQQAPDLFVNARRYFRKSTVASLYSYDAKPYLDGVESSLGAIGWRLHGNMIHLAAGNPAILFSNCSRGDSFCETFGLPRLLCPDGMRLSNGRIDGMIDRFFDPHTFSALPARYAESRAEMARFLDANGLAHNLSPLVTLDAAAPACAVAMSASSDIV